MVPSSAHYVSVVDGVSEKLASSLEALKYNLDEFVRAAHKAVDAETGKFGGALRTLISHLHHSDCNFFL